MPKLLAILICAAIGLSAQIFEVATIKPTPPDWQGGRNLRMTGPQRFVATDYTPRALIAAAYNVNPLVVDGGPAWMDSEHFDVVAATPGETQPTLDLQLAMLRGLVADRFKLIFHREEKELPVYVLSVAKGGPKLKLTLANSSVAEFAALLERTTLDRPVLDRTGLKGSYNFDWKPGGSVFEAIETQLGLKLEATRALVPVMVIDRIERPSEN
jgi:hypothetical protein